MDKNIYESILQNLYDGVYFVDTENRITYWNKGAERISGYTAEEVMGKSCSDNVLRHVDSDGKSLCETLCPLKKTIVDGTLREADVFLHHKHGHRVPVWVRVSPIYNDMNEIIGGVEIFTDNKKQQHQKEEIEDLKTQAFLDRQTNTGNRGYGEMLIKNMLRDKVETQPPFSLLAIDVDNFAVITEKHGHQVADKILMMVAKTISSTLRKQDSVIRWDKGQFLVVLKGMPPGDVITVSERIRIFIEGIWISLAKATMTVTVSIGASMSRRDDSWEKIIQRAEKFMVSSRTSGMNKVTHDIVTP